mgnify:CR=1 FL=1
MHRRDKPSDQYRNNRGTPSNNQGWNGKRKSQKQLHGDKKRSGSRRKFSGNRNGWSTPDMTAKYLTPQPKTPPFDDIDIGKTLHPNALFREYQGSPRIPSQPAYSPTSTIYSPTSPIYSTISNRHPRIKTLKAWNQEMIDNGERSVIDGDTTEPFNQFRLQWRKHVRDNGVIRTASGPVQDKEWTATTEMSREQYEYIRDRCPNQIVDTAQEKKCCICFENEKNMAYPKCGHCCICSDCAEAQILKQDYKCPLCRKVSESIIKIYF